MGTITRYGQESLLVYSFLGAISLTRELISALFIILHWSYRDSWSHTKFWNLSCLALYLGDSPVLLSFHLLSQPQINHNSNQKLGRTRKWIYTTTHHQELNVSNISDVTDPIFTKLSRWVSGINNNNNSQQQQQQQHQQKQQQQQQNIFQLWLTKCYLNFKFRLGPTITTTTKTTTTTTTTKYISAMTDKMLSKL